MKFASCLTAIYNNLHKPLSIKTAVEEIKFAPILDHILPDLSPHWSVTFTCKYKYYQIIYAQFLSD